MREKDKEDTLDPYRVHGSSHVHVNPHPLIVKPQMSSNEQTSTRTLGIAAILKTNKES